jgi:hypothetical protein
MEVIERARRYVAKLEGAIAGSGGHNATFHVACVLVKGFDLSEGEALTVMREYNLRCSPSWSERDLQHKVASAMSLTDNRKRGWMVAAGGGEMTKSEGQNPKGGNRRAEDGGRRAEVVEDRPARFSYDVEALRRMQHPGLVVSRRWLMERSVSDVRYVDAGSFLRAIFNHGERVLTFMSDRSQGEWGYVVGRGWVKLSGEWGPDRKPREREPFPAAGRYVSGDAAGPRSGKLGVWYLSQPVDGMWHWCEEGRWSRRSWRSVTEWRHMVLESDEAPADLYLNWLVQQPLPISAIYTSAGKSVHALLRFEGVKSKAQWDAIREVVMPYFSKVGVDWKTLTAVRLTRLPCCFREGKMVREMEGEKKVEKYVRYPKPRLQRLLYMNAQAGPVAIMDMEQMREVPDERGEVAA